jgi:hypothetical protein
MTATAAGRVTIRLNTKPEPEPARALTAEPATIPSRLITNIQVLVVIALL